jgi:hypothetical protein
MGKYQRAKKGTVCLIKETDDGRIIQIGLTEHQSYLLQSFLVGLSRIDKLVEMGEEWDLLRKNECCNKCKKL